jgi:hypothetical protein
MGGDSRERARKEKPFSIITESGLKTHWILVVSIKMTL